MYDFLLQIIFFTSLAFIIYLLARTLPRVSEEEAASGSLKENYFDKLIKKLPLDKIDVAFNLFTGKILRRLKIVILKIDNLLNRLLNKTKSENKPPQ